MPGVPLADPGVRNYRTGLVRVTRRWSFDLVGWFHGCVMIVSHGGAVVQ